MPVQAVPSDYGSPLGRDPVLAPPTCCCCCCCCTLAVPEALMGAAWARRTTQMAHQAGVHPPVREVLHAYAGGVLAANLMFWIPAAFLGFFLVLITFGVYLAAMPVALLVTLGVQGAVLANRAARASGQNPEQAGAQGFFVGAGLAVLIVGMAIGIGSVVLAVTSNGAILRAPLFGAAWSYTALVPLAGLACIGVSIWLIVRGSRSRRGPMVMRR